MDVHTPYLDIIFPNSVVRSVFFGHLQYDAQASLEIYLEYQALYADVGCRVAHYIEYKVNNFLLPHCAHLK